MRSPAELLASLPEPARMKEIAKLAPDVREQLLYHWPFWARPEQLPPAGAWATWLVLAGRGWGKTRTAAEWVRSVVCGDTPLQGGKYGRLALIGGAAADCRDGGGEGRGENPDRCRMGAQRRVWRYPAAGRKIWPPGADRRDCRGLPRRDCRGGERRAQCASQGVPAGL